MNLVAPKAKKLYDEFVANYEQEVNEEPLRTWDQLTESEQIEWQKFAGEAPQVIGEPMHHPPIATQKGTDGGD